MSNLTFQISAGSVDELADAVKALARAFGQGELAASVSTATVAPDGKSVAFTLDPEVKAAKRAKRDVQPETPPTPAAPAAPAAPAPSTAVTDMSPQEMRAKATLMLMELFNKDPTRVEDLRRLQSEFGVRKFEDIADDRAQDFLMAATLTANGTAEVGRV